MILRYSNLFSSRNNSDQRIEILSSQQQENQEKPGQEESGSMLDILIKGDNQYHQKLDKSPLSRTRRMPKYGQEDEDQQQYFEKAQVSLFDQDQQDEYIADDFELSEIRLQQEEQIKGQNKLNKKNLSIHESKHNKKMFTGKRDLSSDCKDNSSQIPSQTFTKSEGDTKTKSTMINSEPKYGHLVSSPKIIKRPKTYKRVTPKKKKKSKSSKRCSSDIFQNKEQLNTTQ